ncbi:MAG TPA: DUF1501 domain-containing protein [Vicinamibacteria bacterium]|nr:DUF1501 domain-containing protein [Vicinamibacteria bacterium]
MAFDPSRRIFIKGAGVAAVGLGFAPSTLLTRAAEAADAGSRVLVQVFLRGGADGLNLCVPYRDGDYFALRPGIALSTADGVRDLDGFFGLHPRLAPLRDLYGEGVLALHPTIGNAGLTRSHFDAQDFMDTASPGNKTVHDGWLERVARQIPGEDVMQLVALASRTPRSVLGPEVELVLQDLASFSVVAGSGTATWSSEADQLLRAAYVGTGSAVYESGRAVFSAIDTIRRTPALQAGPANGAVYPPGTMGAGLRQAAQLIKADLGTRCIYVNVPGSFDTHANQLAANNAEYTNMSAALVAFRRDLGGRIDDVLLMVTTEFGRTAAQNGSMGTDHGFAHCGLFLGGSVRGGRVHGTWPGLSRSALNEGRDLRYTVDFRDVFASAARWLGVADLGQVIPGYTPATDPGLFS